MKKLLGSTLALALLVPAGANAELLKNFKASGSLEVDAISANNVTDLRTDKYDRISTVQTRLMVHTDWDLLDDVHAHLSINKNNRTYGTGSENVNTVETNLIVDESYVKIDKLFGGLDTTVGRQYYGEQGDLVIYFGPAYQQYGLGITALDAARGDWNGEKIGVTLLAGKVAGGALGAADTGNTNLRGIDVHVKPVDNVSAAVYVYNRDKIRSGNAVGGQIAEDHLYVAGLKGKVTMGGAWLKAEFDQDFGTLRTVPGAASIYSAVGNYTGWAAKANGGLKVDLSNLGAFTGWGEAGIGSGGQTANRNFTAIAGDYRPGSIAGRFVAATTAPLGNTITTGPNTGGTLSNSVTIGAGLKATPAALSKLTVGLSWWNFRVQNATALQNVTAASTGGNKFLGNEYDLDLSWAHSENVIVSAGAGSYQPGRIFGGNVARGQGVALSPATLCYTDLSVKF